MQKKIETEEFENHYHKICIENKEYIVLNYDFKRGVMASTNKNCKCILYKVKGIFGDTINYKFVEIK